MPLRVTCVPIEGAVAGIRIAAHPQRARSLPIPHRGLKQLNISAAYLSVILVAIQ